MPTLISWADETWNPTTGCSHVRDGCRFCYAEGISLRFGWSKKRWTRRNAAENVVLHPERLRKPYAWKTADKAPGASCGLARIVGAQHLDGHLRRESQGEDAHR
jgi:protein gp37